MASNLSFDITIPEGHTLQFNQEATFENFIGQFQLMCPKLLCIIDGTSLRYYDKSNTLPTNIRFDYKQRRGKLTEYYFRDIGNDSLYCVFGREAAKVIYPRIDDVDPLGMSEITQDSHEISNKEDIKSSNRKSPDESLSSFCHPKRPLIIQPIKSAVTILKDVPKTNTRTHLMSTTNKLNYSNLVGSKAESSIPNKINVPENIIIIDKGVKLTFPNPNYPIEITMYYP